MHCSIQGNQSAHMMAPAIWVCLRSRFVLKFRSIAGFSVCTMNSIYSAPSPAPNSSLSLKLYSVIRCSLLSIPTTMHSAAWLFICLVDTPIIGKSGLLVKKVLPVVHIDYRVSFPRLVIVREICYTQIRRFLCNWGM